MFRRWSQPNGYRHVLAVGLPLVVSFGTTSLIHFTDRVFLANYSMNAIAAALPAGIASFLTICFFMGVVSYVNVFVAQYVGAGAFQRVGASLWQGIYFSLASALFLASLYLIAEPLFRFAGHHPQVMRLEVVYFRILTLGAGAVVLATNLSCFFSGRGLTRPVMLVNLAGATLNIPLDYVLINGVGFFPEMGIAGAAVATVSSQVLVMVLFALAVFTKSNDRRFAVRRSWSWDSELMRRMLRYGLPGGVQFFLDILVFTFFVFMIGRLGRTELAATNIVMAINTLSFLPMIGLSVAVSTLVGQAIGAGKPSGGVRATTSTLHIALIYMGLVALAFVLLPRELLSFFESSHASAASQARMVDLGVQLLRFVAVYSLFDAMALVYMGALKGAGDILFVMWTMALACLGMVITPMLLGVEVLGLGLYYIWGCVTFYVVVLGVVFRWRYGRGLWQKMRVIEAAPRPE
ncbi:MAG: MATE family efflux transporter [Deltaproteobacteria bacterium]|nr:MATE family efflux transporter [Deltaproteobacteria bacterium]